MRTKGKIAAWNDERGYGFIKPLAGGKQIFIHATAFGNRDRRPEVNEVVTYSMSRDAQGRPCAANATLAGDRLKKRTQRKSSKTIGVTALLFPALVAVSVVTGNLSPMILIAYVALSLSTFVAYALDKSAAQSGSWRTSEGTLLLLGLLGGWPGALVAQQTLRHKSKKLPFRSALWMSILLNCIALAWLHTEGGKEALQRLIS